MGCGKRGDANGRPHWQASRQRRPPEKPRPSGLRQNAAPPSSRASHSSAFCPQRNPRGTRSEVPWPVVVEKERREQRREIEDGKTESAPGQRVAVAPVERERMTEERDAERQRCGQIQQAAHA